MALVPGGKPAFAERFSHARMSYNFVIGVTVWIALWIGWNLLPGLPHFDPYVTGGAKFDLLNFLMSAEQCISNPLIWMGMGAAMLADRTSMEERHKAEMATMAEVLTATRDLLARFDDVADDVAGIADDVAVIEQEIISEE